MRILAAVIVLSASLHAQLPPERASKLDELLTVMKVKQNYERSLEEMLKVMDSATAGQMPLDDASKKELSSILRDHMLKTMAWERIKPKMAALYAEELTDVEIDGLLAFYRSPVGQSTVDKLPQIFAKSIAIGQKLAADSQPEFMEKLKRFLESRKPVR